MQTRTILVLSVVVALLGLLFLQQQRERGRLAAGADVPLLPGLEPGSVAAIRIDHLERGVQVVLERDAIGLWSMTEPVPYPADPVVVRGILDVARRLSGSPVDDADLGELGLDPPRVVLLLEVALDGGRRRLRLEVGRDDIDGVRLFARVGGKGVFLTSRSLFSTLDQNPHDYRDTHVTTLEAGDVVGFRRSGRMALEPGGAEVELGLDVQLEPGGWTALGPGRVALDPTAMGLLVRGACGMRVEGFFADAPAALAHFGLDPPAMRVELESSRGGTVGLRFGRPASDEQDPERLLWLCAREGYPFVWRVKARNVLLLARPAEELFDYRVLRVRRGDVAGIELVRGDVETQLVREDGAWRVDSRRGGHPAGALSSYPADAAAVEGLLSALSFAELRAVRPDLEVGPAARPLGSIAVVTGEGARLGGELLAVDPAWGVQGPLAFRRFGDDAPGFLDGDLLELAGRPAASWRSPIVLELDEVRLESLRLARTDGAAPGQGGGRTFRRDVGTGVWYDDAIGSEVLPGHAFYAVLERLLELRAVVWLGEGLETPLRGGIRVVVRGSFPSEHVLGFGRTADGRAACEIGGARAEVAAELLADLEELLSG